ncbi:hypothetical protein ABUE25_15975 [Acinetobacter baumannii]|uniref:hypothetical protein n=1 Tax=Acinetobacter baumannii TaxID=470 RepID=UPI001F50D761|nr:hypothetical protein [Acinetobacter baumannii]UNI12401.1 hypothetical protein L2M54_05590 [Acinetobacter baumannii]
MARARNIKPSFFMNEDIIELPYEARLLFIGLWTLADREGRLENRPKKIKMSLFPADDINVAEQLDNISKLGFIELYNADGIDVIQIVNFVKHQTPHGLEKDSELPDRNGIYTVYQRNPKNKTIVGKAIQLNKSDLKHFYDKTGPFAPQNTGSAVENSYQESESNQANSSGNTQEQLDNGSKTVSISDQNALNPESFNLNPESFNKNICPPNGEPMSAEKPKENFKNEIQEVFEFWKVTFNKNNRTVLDNPRKSKIQARLKEGYTVEDIKTAIVGCSKSQFHIEGNHTDLTLICRDATKLDHFLAMSNPAQVATQPQTEDEQPAPTQYKVIEGRW